MKAYIRRLCSRFETDHHLSLLRSGSSRTKGDAVQGAGVVASTVYPGTSGCRSMVSGAGPAIGAGHRPRLQHVLCREPRPWCV